MKFILMCLTFVSHFTSKYFQTAIHLTPLMNESNLWSITLQVLEFVHQQIIYINATYLKLDVLPKGCIFLSILGALFDGQSPETNESSISVHLWTLH